MIFSSRSNLSLLFSCALRPEPALSRISDDSLVSHSVGCLVFFLLHTSETPEMDHWLIWGFCCNPCFFLPARNKRYQHHCGSHSGHHIQWWRIENYCSSDARYRDWLLTPVLIPLDIRKHHLGFICVLDFSYTFWFHVLGQSGFFFTCYHCLLSLYFLRMWMGFEGLLHMHVLNWLSIDFQALPRMVRSREAWGEKLTLKT